MLQTPVGVCDPFNSIKKESADVESDQQSLNRPRRVNFLQCVTVDRVAARLLRNV